MRHRTTVEQGVTFRQIFCEVYSDIVEKYAGKNIRYDTGQVYDYTDDSSYGGKAMYLRRMMKQVRKTDDDFRWLSLLESDSNGTLRLLESKAATASEPKEEYEVVIESYSLPELLRALRDTARNAMYLRIHYYYG